ncbi:MAG: tetratricopeptide repeat protein [Aquabacterium sp.]|uniref:tetratricopeptide repeat protein n=1 Tax=Aquabacterium sp. TaxID=1872578 RepID=UPI0012186BB4|nr:tetratricopeptide repeat protein [Aquabacterium sp.]TAK86634.1 MAG: tetratricopeptide repeat protein [Aquabacterium sp.]
MNNLPAPGIEPSDLAQTQQEAQAAFAMGVAQQSAGQVQAAMASFHRALVLQPDMAEAWSNLGMLLEDSQQWDEAASAYQQALQHAPALFAAWLNLATLQAQRLQFDQAEASFQRAIQLQPEDPAVWSNLGAMLTCMRREDDALACLQQALQLDPGYDKARFNLGYLLMRQGHLREGWLCNESRPFPHELQAKLGITRWMGDALQGRSILIAPDAAHGDLIHMVRYVPVLKALGAGRIGIWGQPALKRLLREVDGLDDYFALDEPFAPAAWDCWVPLMSLPYVCGTTLDTIPAHLPYLHADPVRVAARAAQGMVPSAHADVEHARPALRVGLVWRGNPAHENDAQRSLPSLVSLAPLWRVPGVRFFSLQSGAGSEEALSPPADQPLEALAEPLGDFHETAAVVRNLDLVIGVDTSMVHLAGALGQAVWVLLSDYKTDWRWMDDRADSPWYPGVMRLFRQDAVGPQAGQWAPVIERVAQALSELAASGVSPAGEAR